MSKGVGTLAVLIALAVTIALPSGVSQAAATHTNVVIEWNQTMLATFAAIQLHACGQIEILKGASL